ncbi:DUF4252 domain-containing protein [Carboxylicivirga taeanensis]|uniref:DUF4252 domain-containing protein n=1 Tax=Carboxylicivirga taeanensis TaxID=1416875 RepID=UPI003F6E41E2
MKQLFAFVLIAALGLATHAQDRYSDKLFEKMALEPGITIMTFSKEMLDAVNLSFDDEEGNEESTVNGDLHEVKLIIYKAPDKDEPMAFKDVALRYLPLRKYEKVEDDEADEDVDIRILRKGKKVSECHVLFQGETNGILLSFFGNFKIDEVGELAEKLDDYK